MNLNIKGLKTIHEPVRQWNMTLCGLNRKFIDFTHEVFDKEKAMALMRVSQSRMFTLRSCIRGQDPSYLVTVLCISTHENL